MSTHELPIRDHSDVVRVRHEVRAWTARHGFSVVDQTKIVTAASELARNTLVYGLGGTCTLEWIDERGRNGLRLVFADSGPGIPDIQEALRDGFTSGNGMGLGLGGARRLMSDFEIRSEVGKGTRITAVRWKP